MLGEKVVDSFFLDVSDFPPKFPVNCFVEFFLHWSQGYTFLLWWIDSISSFEFIIQEIGRWIERKNFFKSQNMQIDLPTYAPESK